MKASDYIAQFIAQQGVSHIFGYIGGMITHLVDSIDKNPNVQFIQAYHEQTGAIAAEGLGHLSGKVGGGDGSRGPGVTNMMTGIADAFFGNIPVIFISGQVNTYEYKYDKPIRQQGFQEMEVVNVVKPITKYAVLLDKAEDIRYELEKALHIATTGRKGPVVIDLPMNISRAEINPDNLRSFIPEPETVKTFDVQQVVSLLESAKRPMLLLGGGAIGADKQIADFIAKSQMPVVTSLMGRGTTDETYDHYVGMIGSYGNRCANMTVAKADLLIALGSRLDTRQTGAMYQEFIKDGKIIHVDIDNNELESHRLENRVKVNTSVIDFLEKINASKIKYNDYTEWNAWVGKIKSLYNQDQEIDRFVENKSPYRFLQKLNEITCENDIITVDVGQNEMWGAQTIKLKKGQRFVCSGGLAPMGFSMPVAIGMAFANPKKRIFCINGDGGFHMALQSMLLISQYNLNIKVIVMNNEALGMITQFQHLYFNDNMAGTTAKGGYIVPNLKAIADSFGFPYHQMDENNFDNNALSEAGFALVDYQISGLTTVCPKLEYNKPIWMPLPLLGEEEYKQLNYNSMTIKTINGGG